MRRFSTSCLVVAVLACGFVIASSVRADDPPASDQSTGKISGVVMKDGKPLANARVVVLQGRQKLGKKARKNAAPATQPSDSAEAKNQDRPRHKPLNQTSSDADGKFTLQGLKPGDYVVMAGIRDQGRGRQRVSVAAGQDSTVQIDVKPADDNNAGGDNNAPKPRGEKQAKHFRKLGL